MPSTKFRVVHILVAAVIRPFSPPVRALIVIAHRVQHSLCSAFLWASFSIESC